MLSLSCNAPLLGLNLANFSVFYRQVFLLGKRNLSGDNGNAVTAVLWFVQLRKFSEILGFYLSGIICNFVLCANIFSWEPAL